MAPAVEGGGKIGKWGVDPNKQVYLGHKLSLVKDPAKMPRKHMPDDWEEATSRIGKKFRVIGKNGGTVRAGIELDSEKLGMLDLDDIVEVIDSAKDGERVRIEIDAPLEGWVSLALCGPCDAAPSGGIP